MLPLAFLAALAVLLPQAAFSELLTDRPAYAGVWVNTFGTVYNLTPYTNFIAGEADRLKWSDMEPTEGVTDFSGLDTALTRARDRGYYYYFVLWTGPDAPNWIYNSPNNVPKVTTDTGGSFPYYLNANYKRCATNFIDKLAGFLATLPDDKRDRLAFIQPGFGSTGDRQLYKGNPIDSQYNINSSNYLAFMQFMTTSMRNSFNARPETQSKQFMWNIDDYDGSNTNLLTGVSDDASRGEMLYAAWIRSFGEGQFKKQQFTLAIGYMVNNELDDDIVQRPSYYGYGTPLRWNGNPEFVRGEHNDAVWAETPMAKKSLKWHFYWTAIQSVDRGLDAWETKPDYIMTGNYNEAYQFSTRHSFQKKADKATQAFIALRDVLDYSDTNRFSVGGYGAALKNNATRINSILAQYAAYGATNEDTATVTSQSGSKYLSLSSGLNDCVWNVIGRNYQRHITQFDPNGTSVGLWRVGSTNQPYGRFARGFQHASGKDAMYFNFAADFPAKRAAQVTFKVIYYDKTTNSTWAFKYDSGSSNLATALSVTNIGDVTWKTVSVTVTNAVLQNNGPNGSDFALVNTDGLDDIFHMIEVTYADVRYPLTVNSGSGGGLYTNGQQVAISASNLVGQTFVRWVGDTQYVNNVTYTNALVTMPTNAVTLTATYVDVSYALTANGGLGGTVSPASTNVLSGGSATFVVMASNYYRIATLTANGTAVTGMSFDNNSTTTNFTWSNVQTSGVLAATFTAQVVTNAADTPHEWLAGYGLTNSGSTFDQAAAADQDGDGLTAWQEYIAGTDPTNTTSGLMAAQNNRNVITWSPAAGRVYSVYWATNLLSGFQPLETNILYPQGSYTNATSDPRINLYQIKVRMQ